MRVKHRAVALAHPDRPSPYPEDGNGREIHRISGREPKLGAAVEVRRELEAEKGRVESVGAGHLPGAGKRR